MKRTVALALLGIGTAMTAFGQGGIIIGNYRTDYNPVMWEAGVPDVGGNAVLSTEGVTLTLWYGKGQGASALTDSIDLQWNTVAEAQGYAGYYQDATLSFPTWASGDIYSFQIVAGGTAMGQSAIFEESAAIQDISGDPPGLPGVSSQSIGFTVVPIPEPTSLALAGLGAAGLLLFRRRS